MADDYTRVHDRLRRQRGSASRHVCPCGKQAHDWAYDRTDPNEVKRASGTPFSLALTFYLALCRSCHQRLDADLRRDSYSKAAKASWASFSKAREARKAQLRKQFQKVAADGGRASAAIVNKRKRVCVGCGLSTNPGNLGKHQRASGHTGFYDVEV